MQNVGALFHSEVSPASAYAQVLSTFLIKQTAFHSFFHSISLVLVIEIEVPF